MRVAILGSGVAGVTAAHFVLRALPHASVVVIDRNSEAALGNSYANSGILSPLHSGPLINSSTLRFMLNNVRFQSSASRNFAFTDWSNPRFWRFMAEASLLSLSPDTVGKNTADLFHLSAFSCGLAESLIESLTCDLKHSTGVIDLFSDEADFKAASQYASVLSEEYGYRIDLIDGNDISYRIPALAKTGFVGGTICSDEFGSNCRRFVLELAQQCESRGVEFLYEKEISHLISSGDKVNAARTVDSATGQGEEILEADLFLSCLGTDDRGVMNECGEDLGLYPVAGYSVTAPYFEASSERLDNVVYILENDGRRTLFSPIGDGVRVAGYAECSGWATSPPKTSRVNALKSTAEEYFPHLANWRGGVAWRGFRPMRPDGMPQIGQSSKYKNMFVSGALGNIGFILSCGAASLIADMISGKSKPLQIGDKALYDRVRRKVTWRSE